MARNMPTVRPKKILLIGDSLAVGMTKSFGSLAAAAGIPFAASAEVGTRADQWTSRVVPLLAQHRPDLVMVSLGTNDSALADPARNLSAMQLIVATVENAGADVLWIEPPTLPQKYGASTLQESVVRDMIRGLGVRTFDSSTLTIPRGGDHLHPTPAGYASWANAVWPYVVGPKV